MKKIKLVINGNDKTFLCSNDLLLLNVMNIYRGKNVAVALNSELVKKMVQVIDDGFTICLWPKSIVQKDINDMILNGLSAKIVEQTINENKFSGLSAKMALSDWSKVSG